MGGVEKANLDWDFQEDMSDLKLLKAGHPWLDLVKVQGSVGQVRNGIPEGDVAA